MTGRIALISSMKKSSSASTINIAMAVLSSVLGYAITEGLITTNPMRSVPRGSRPRTQRKKITILSDQELRDLLEALPQPYNDVAYVQSRTRLRMMELLGQQWGDRVCPAVRRGRVLRAVLPGNTMRRALIIGASVLALAACGGEEDEGRAQAEAIASEIRYWVESGEGNHTGNPTVTYLERVERLAEGVYLIEISRPEKKGGLFYGTCLHVRPDQWKGVESFGSPRFVQVDCPPTDDVIAGP